MKKIETEVAGKNKVTAAIKKEIESLIPQLEKLVGKKLFKGDGSLTIAVKDSIKFTPKPENDYLTRSLKDSYGQLLLSVCVTERVGIHSAEYYERSITIGKMQENSGILLNVYPIGWIIADCDLTNIIDLETVRCQVEEYNRKKKELDELKSLIPIDKNLLA